jgi:hypothetical protein
MFRQKSVEEVLAIKKGRFYAPKSPPPKDDTLSDDKTTRNNPWQKKNTVRVDN